MNLRPIQFLLTLALTQAIAPAADYKVEPLTAELHKAYLVDGAFYKKGIVVQDILIATSERVADHALLEAAYQFDMVMGSIDPQIAQRVRDKKVLCILIGHEELTSDLPQFGTDKTGKELDFYNWRQRGFLTSRFKRPIVVFAEEDVLEYEGGMQIESILIHEFGHVIHGAGFSDDQQSRLTQIYEEAKAKGLWNDGRAAQRFRRVTSAEPVSLLGALTQAFPDEDPELMKKYLDGGDILVNGNATNSAAQVTKDDQVVIVFGGEKECYAHKNRAEYWAEGVQCWYDTNRTMDHDHNHIHTRAQLKAYDTGLAKLCEEVLGNGEWRFVSPRLRAGKEHLDGFDPAKSPVTVDPDHIKAAANDYYDEYWKDFWQRLRNKYTSTDPVRRLLYVAEPGIRNYQQFGGHGILVFDIDAGHKFLKRIPTAGLDDKGEPLNVKGICASAEHKRVYVSTLRQLMCIDLVTDKLLWEHAFEFGCDRMSISPDGNTIYLPSLENDYWYVVDAFTGNEIARIAPKSGAHNTVFGPDGTEVYLAGLRSPTLTVAETATHTAARTVGPFSDRIRPFTVNGKQTLCFANVNNLLGFEVGDLKLGTMLYRVEVKGFEKGPVERHGCPSHGIAMTPDEKELWISDGANSHLHVFDATVMPPTQIASIATRSQPGWVTFSIDGTLAYPSTGDVIDTQTRKVIAQLTDEEGRMVQSEKLLEIDFRGDRPIRNGDQFGIGQLR